MNSSGTPVSEIILTSGRQQQALQFERDTFEEEGVLVGVSISNYRSIVYDTVHFFIFELAYPVSHNALLRCEQRNTKSAVCHLKHLNQRIVKMPRVANPS